jgi:DNA replication protein DnaC
MELNQLFNENDLTLQLGMNGTCTLDKMPEEEVVVDYPEDEFVLDGKYTRGELMIFANPESIEQFENVASSGSKKLLEKVMLMRARRALREAKYIEVNGPFEPLEVALKCTPRCKKVFDVYDDSGPIAIECLFSDCSFCQLSQENREKYELTACFLKSFYRGVVPKEAKDAVIEGSKQIIQEKLPAYLKLGIKTKGLNVYGYMGVGKTSVFYLCMKELHQQGKEFFFATSSQIFDAYHDNDVATIQRLESVEYLYIDDLGREYPADFLVAKFDNLLSNRWDKGMITSVTMNIFEKQFEEVYPRVYDRLRGGNQTIIIPGESNRPKTG